MTIKDLERRFNQLLGEQELAWSLSVGWAAFAALAREPLDGLVLDLADELVFDVMPAYDGQPVVVDLSRRVQNHTHDGRYIDTTVFSCMYVYEGADAAAAVSAVESISGFSASADVPPDGRSWWEFIQQVEVSEGLNALRAVRPTTADVALETS